MKTLSAYNVNIDAVHSLSGDEITELLKGRKISSTNSRKSTIKTPEDFLSWLLHTMREGSGAELLVEGKEVTSFIESSFDWEYRMGGNAGNMANALGELGSEAVVNVPSMSRMQASLFHPLVKVPTFKDGELTLKSPEETSHGGEDLVHFVLQFGEGEIVNAHEGTIISPRENRLIATRDPLNSALCADPAFDAYSKEKIHEIDGALISGYHLVPSTAADGKSYNEVMDKALLRQRVWKRRRPDLYIHVELGGFESVRIMRHVLQNLTADSIGMNEDELATLVRSKPGRVGWPDLMGLKDWKGVWDQRGVSEGGMVLNWKSLLEAARKLRSYLGVRRICVHTRDYIASVIDDLIDPSSEVEALTYGADVAAALVSKGLVMKKPEVDDLEVSAAGARATDEFCRNYGALRVGRGAYAQRGDEALCIAPSLFARRPILTVGIGDAMTAATYHREVEAILEQS